MTSTISAKEAEERKTRIRDTAYLLFKEKGVDNVTYHDVSKLSGISEASIYHYYKKKSFLLFDTYQYLWQEINVELRKLTIQNDRYNEASGYQQIECLISSFERVYFERGGDLKFALESKLYWNRQSLRVINEDHERIVAPVIQLFTDALAKGVEDGSICLQADQQISGFLLWGILRAYIEQIVILDGFYVGENQYRIYFQTMKEILLKSLR